MALEKERRTSLDILVALQEEVTLMEKKWSIEVRWTPDSPDWKKAVNNEQEWEYRQAIDQLESLAVTRLFELTKMHQSGVGE
jgi:hypothetical protein